jgi:hypothetical protein
MPKSSFQDLRMCLIEAVEFGYYATDRLAGHSRCAGEKPCQWSDKMTSTSVYFPYVALLLRIEATLQRLRICEPTKSI